MWNLKYGTNEPIYKTNSIRDTENSLVIAKEEGDRGAIQWEAEVSRYKLLYMKWINNILLYSTGNYIQHSKINTLTLLVGMQTGTATMENSVEIS